MKKQQLIHALFTFVSLALLVSACRSGGLHGTAGDLEIRSPYTASQIAEVIIDALTDTPPFLLLAQGDAGFSDYLCVFYQIDEDSVTDGAICYADGAYASEIAILKLAPDPDRILQTKEALENYVHHRADLFAGYAPTEADILKRSRVVSHGPYLALLICLDPQKAESLFLACFSESLPALPAPVFPDTALSLSSSDVPGRMDAPISADGLPPLEGADSLNGLLPFDGASPQDGLPPHEGADSLDGLPPLEGAGSLDGLLPFDGADTPYDRVSSDNPDRKGSLDSPDAPDELYDPDDLYDHDAILAAWRSGDTGALSPKNLAIYEACLEVISALIVPDMNAYAKELAVHDWIVIRAEYDQEALSHSPDAKPDPENDNPYGLLSRGKAICTGFTSSFQLFMDLLEVECITVHGFAGSEEHAWNMVRLDGVWYCVDVTWDTPIRAVLTDEVMHKYFNVPSTFMRNTNHQWDSNASPEATAPKLYPEKQL